jgi:hypothetical protein
MLTNYASFPENRYSAVLLVSRIQKAASIVIKKFQKATSAHKNRFPKAAGKCMMKSTKNNPTPANFWKTFHMAISGFQKVLCDGFSGFQEIW